MIKLHSTNRNAPQVDFKDAILKGQAPDKGLYMLDEIPQLNNEEIFSFRDLELPQIAYKVRHVVLKMLEPECSQG